MARGPIRFHFAGRLERLPLLPVILAAALTAGAPANSLAQDSAKASSAKEDEDRKGSDTAALITAIGALMAAAGSAYAAVRGDRKVAQQARDELKAGVEKTLENFDARVKEVENSNRREITERAQHTLAEIDKRSAELRQATLNDTTGRIEDLHRQLGQIVDSRARDVFSELVRDTARFEAGMRHVLSDVTVSRSIWEIFFSKLDSRTGRKRFARAVADGIAADDHLAAKLAGHLARFILLEVTGDDIVREELRKAISAPGAEATVQQLGSLGWSVTSDQYRQILEEYRAVTHKPPSSRPRARLRPRRTGVSTPDPRPSTPDRDKKPSS